MAVFFISALTLVILAFLIGLIVQAIKIEKMIVELAAYVEAKNAQR
jgi:hypothetical protein